MKTNLMKSILHLKEDTEYQIPLRETEKDRAKVGADVETTVPNSEAVAKKETKAGEAANEEKVNNEKEDTATQSQDDPTANRKTEEISREEVTNEDDPALNNLEEENPNQEHPNTGESNSGTTTESAPQVDSAKAALDEMKKLASQEGVVHPSLFISNFSKILGLMERAMQLQVKESGSATEESGSATEESGSVTKEEAPKATEQAETTEKTETPAKDKQGELNGNNNRS